MVNFYISDILILKIIDSLILKIIEHSLKCLSCIQ